MAEANLLDRVIQAVAPRWGVSRMRARVLTGILQRHYDAAAPGRRTANWSRSGADANVAAGGSLSWLRAHSRDLDRNNSWASNGIGVIVDNAVGTGIVPKAVGGNSRATALWKSWAETTECDADGRLTFAGLQALAMRTVALSGEALVRRRWRQPRDDLSIPMQLQLLEPDMLDTMQDSRTGQQGGSIIQGVEFDAIGRRVAYWLYDKHPGSNQSGFGSSHRVDASEIIHVYRIDRPGQVRGVPWLCTAIMAVKDFDEFEDAQLMRQKIAACFSAFVTDVNGETSTLGSANAADDSLDELGPGLVSHLAPGQEVTFGNPPLTTEDGFSTRTLRKIAAGLRVTYEDLTGDYSQVNFSSARMGRIKHTRAVDSWRWNMLIPHFCAGAWDWAMEVANAAGLIGAAPTAEWTAPATPMIEPDREGLALQRMVRTGAKTPSEMIREQGYDPEAFFAEYAADMKRLDALGIKLDCDVRAVSQAGLTQERVGGAGGKGGGKEPPPEPPTGQD